MEHFTLSVSGLHLKNKVKQNIILPSNFKWALAGNICSPKAHFGDLGLDRRKALTGWATKWYVPPLFSVMQSFAAFTTTATTKMIIHKATAVLLQTALKTHLCHDVYKNLTMVRQTTFCNYHLFHRWEPFLSYLLFALFAFRDDILLYVPNI